MRFWERGSQSLEIVEVAGLEIIWLAFIELKRATLDLELSQTTHNKMETF